MDFQRFLPHLKSWTLPELACAAGLLGLSAGAGYYIYRHLRRGSAPHDHTHTQPQTHEPVDVLEEASDTPSVLQVVEPNLQLLPTEPHQEPSSAVVLYSAGELNRACRNIQFLSADFCSSQSESADIRSHFLEMIRGPESQLCWFKTTETCYLTHEGFPYRTTTEDWFTGIRGLSGRVTELISCNRVETSVIVPLEDYVVTCTYLHVGADDQVDTSTWVQEHSQYSPYSDSENQPDSEESEESLTPEEMEVPFMSYHLADRGVTDIGLKLHALRQAFSTLLASTCNQKFLFLVGQNIVMQLAAANNQDVVGVKLAYESLIEFLRRPSNQDSIVAELFSANLHHYNFLDVFCELLLFGYINNGSAPEAFEGGFLERLFTLISMWDVDVWDPAAELYFLVLIDHLAVLFEALFSQPLELYTDPAALASAVLHLLRQHVQLMMDYLERL